MKQVSGSQPETPVNAPDHSNNPAFVVYYSQEDIAARRKAHFTRIYDALTVFRADMPGQTLNVLDIGGGAGDAAMVWARAGHRTVCVDISSDLIAVGTSRSEEQNLDIDFRVGSATDLPVDDESCDVVLLPELLEHVADWQTCLDEVGRVLKPGGITFLSTTNKWCPKQQEFRLPLYSWYPHALKKYCVQRSLTDKPEWVNYATYPAVNWFTMQGLRKALEKRGFDQFWGRSDMVLARGISGWKGVVARCVSTSPLIEGMMQPFIPSSLIVARKSNSILS